MKKISSHAILEFLNNFIKNTLFWKSIL